MGKRKGPFILTCPEKSHNFETLHCFLINAQMVWFTQMESYYWFSDRWIKVLLASFWCCLELDNGPQKQSWNEDWRQLLFNPLLLCQTLLWKSWTFVCGIPFHNFLSSLACDMLASPLCLPLMSLQVYYYDGCFRKLTKGIFKNSV